LIRHPIQEGIVPGRTESRGLCFTSHADRIMAAQTLKT